MSSSEIRKILNLLENITLMELTDKVKQQQFDRLQSENPNQNPEEIKKYINAWDSFSHAFPPDKKDITKLSFQEISKLIRDASFKSSLKGKETPFHKKPEINRDMDLLYNKNGLEILKGDMKEKCIQYGKNSKWCISRNDAENMFYSYRMRFDEPMFYFVFDIDKPETDPLHRFVIHIDKNGNYKLTNFNNSGDKEMSWNEIEQIQPKLRGLQKLFVHQPLSPEEKTDYKKYENTVDLKTYQNYSLEEKYKYIKFGHELDSDQQDATPTELIGVYAKGLPTKITNKTLNRLNSSDLKKVISDIVDENNNISPIDFYRDVLQTPWHLSGLPENIIDQAHKKITAMPELSSDYANKIMNVTGDATQIPDVIVKEIAIDPELSLKYANDIVFETKDTSEVPDVIVKAIATDSKLSTHYALSIFAFTEDKSKIPDIIMKSIKQSDEYYNELKKVISNSRNETNETQNLMRLKMLSGII